MAKQHNTNDSQLTFDDLDEALNAEPGKLLKLPISAKDIGGELLSVLSKGLYTNPLDSIREYVQNAVDARASNVTIKITGNSVAIMDNGNGMNLAELIQSRQFGLSGKSLNEHVGFRGIGIYSGFDLCTKLRISTKKSGESVTHILVFDFAAMKARLDEDKSRTPNRDRASLFELLSEHTSVGRQPLPTGSDINTHFTIAELQDISDVHIREISNRAKVRTYLLLNLPIDFSEDFEYKKLINERLYQNVPGYNAITVTLQSDGIPDETVAKEAIKGLQKPEFEFICTSSQQQVAYYWAALNSERGKIDRERDKLSDTGDQTSYEGFVYKVKGFTIGDRNKLREAFRRKPQLYPWYTGEIYVLDTNVVPNAERNDFETNQAKRALQLAVNEKLSKLETEVESFQARGVADERVQKYQNEVEALAASIEANTQQSDFEAYSRLDEILGDLKRQKPKASLDNKKIAEELVRRAEKAQRQLRKEVDTPTAAPSRNKKAARSEKATRTSTVPLPELTPPAPVRLITDVLRDYGWMPEGQIGKVCEIFQLTLEDVFGLQSESYRRVITYLEGKLAASNGEPE